MSESQAVLLCAGSGTRVQDVSNDTPKSLLHVNGQSILHRALDQLEAAGIGRITVIGGYEWEQLEAAIQSRASLVVWNGWQTSNNLWTLAGRREVLESEDDIVILFGDVLLAPGVLDRVVKAKSDVALAVDLSSRLEGTMRVRFASGRLAIGNHVSTEECDGNFIGVLKLSAQAAKRVGREIASRYDQGVSRSDYYTVVLPDVLQGLTFEYLDVAPANWAEVDTAEDLDLARAKFETVLSEGNH